MQFWQVLYVLRSFLVHGEKEHLFDFYQLLKVHLQNCILKSLFIIISHTNHCNTHMKKSLRSFAMTLTLQQCACSETGHS